MRVIFDSYQELSDILFGTDTEPEVYKRELDLRDQLDHINTILTEEAERCEFDTPFLTYVQNFIGAVIESDIYVN